jgi:hypothetical protein
LRVVIAEDNYLVREGTRRLQVTSAPGHGTRLLARLPAQAASLA